ncbi:MAG: DUF1016 domain-containing protein, partial [Bacteroidales bacterium]|nr:DUF1016 domain-containing protein [Bacteroidales bacterium]
MKSELTQTTENSFINDVKKIVEQGRAVAYSGVNAVMIDTYWHIGRRIVEQEQKGKERAEYGKQLIKTLSAELTRAYGRGWSVRNLQYFKSFYLTYSDIQLVQSRLHNLTWTHILTTLRVEDPIAARWYLQTASDEMWSVRTLDRNISTQYFERHFKQPQILDKPENRVAPDKMEILKSPVVAEFLGFQPNT